MQCSHMQIGITKRGTTYEYPCGQCMPCRIRKRDAWSLRIQLEAMDHPHSIFSTLTYDREHYPEDGNLNKRELQLFFKRLRKAGLQFRYFACGEYGTRTNRAHYHAVFFGLTLDHEEVICENWKNGFVAISDLTPGRATYVAKYTTKAIVSQESLPDGRVPEFALMSRRPGLGSTIYNAVQRRLQQKGIASHLCHINEDTVNSMMTNVIFNGSLRLGGRILPLDRYGKEKIIKTEGFDNDLYLQTLAESNFAQGGSVFDEVLKRADATLSGHTRAQVAFRKQKNREVL